MKQRPPLKMDKCIEFTNKKFSEGLNLAKMLRNYEYQFLCEETSKIFSN
ncbi:Uncharacterised protein [uncultured archaeon]|nr:Uncharacterised protein [uncultured archaeon]